jgi:hypothetical protein
MSKRELAGIVVVTGIAVACGIGVTKLGKPHAPPTPGPVLSEHLVGIAAEATKSFGADCTSYGNSECASGLCLHLDAHPEKGYRCSSSCASDRDCSADGKWRCGQLFPGPNGRACVPQASN